MKILMLKIEDVSAISIKIKSGTYFLLNSEYEVIYVGKAQDVVSRVQSHKASKEFSTVVIIETKDSYDAQKLESLYLNINLPLLNKVRPQHTDIPLWILRKQIEDTEGSIRHMIIEEISDFKSDIRSDMEKFIKKFINER